MKKTLISALVLVGLLAVIGTAFAYTTTLHPYNQCSGATPLGTSGGADETACLNYCATFNAGCCTVRTTDINGEVSYTCTAKTQTTYSVQGDTFTSCFDGSETCTHRHWDAYVMDYSVPLPTATLSASPTSITSGSSSTLTWSSTNATSCTGTGFTAGSTGGTASVSPPNTTTYSVTCTGAGGGPHLSQAQRSPSPLPHRI